MNKKLDLIVMLLSMLMIMFMIKANLSLAEIIVTIVYGIIMSYVSKNQKD